MPFKTNLFLSFLLSLFIVFSPSVSKAGEIKTDFLNIPYTQTVLDNGLTVIIHEDHKAPIVAVNVWYHVGSKNEPKGRNGFAHLFEHLMFQGSENFNADYFKALEKIGATDLNGTTNEDRTNYFQTVPATAFETALFMESDRMGHFVNAISQARLDEQRGVVLNEKRQGENTPYWGIAEELISKSAFPAGHPYSWTTIGSYEDLNAAKLEDVKTWFKTYYGPSNATLTIVGDIQTQDALEKVKKYFGDIPSGPRIARMKEWIAKRTETKNETVQDNVPYAKLLKIWNIPGITSMQFDALDMVSDILSEGRSSRLYKDIVYDQQLATDISAGLWPSEIASLFVIDATAKEGVSLERLEQAIDRTLNNFFQKGVTADEIKRSNTRYTAQFIEAMEKIGGFGGKANLLASNQVFRENPAAYKDHYNYRMSLTPAIVKDAAKTWLSSGDYNLSITPFPKFQKTGASIDRSKVPQATSFPDVRFPKIEEATLSNGIRVLFAQRKHVPQLKMSVLIKTGYSHDPKDKLGTGMIAFNMLGEGTKQHDLFAISDMLARQGSSISSFSGINYSGFYFKSLKDNIDPTLSLLSEMILSPAFLPKEFDRIKKETIEGIRQEQAEPRSITSRVMGQLLYGKEHPYGVPLAGTGFEKTINAIQLKDAVDFYNTWSKPNNTTIVAVGDLTLSELTEKLEKHLRSWKQGKVPEFNAPVLTKEVNAGKIFLVDRPHAPQTAMYGAQFFPYYNDPNDVPNTLMNSILGGSFTSRINMNLRETKGWSYGSFSGFVDLQDRQFWIIRSPVQTDKTALALREIQKEVAQFQNQTKPITMDEFQAQKANQILELSGVWETNDAILGPMKGLVYAGLKKDFYEDYIPKLKNVTMPQVVQSGKTTLHPASMVWLLIGDQNVILPELQKAGFKDITFIDADGNVKK